ncbi:hypothetical protein DMA11_03340 [Marinilabiliaceae bacterium JC017]|nr:hypothetical protein DMA11_03340 [Marinilabiliaceae bacterium JC017]
MMDILNDKFEETKYRIKNNGSIKNKSKEQLNKRLDNIYLKVQNNINNIEEIFINNNKAKHNILFQLYSKYSEFIYVNEEDVLNEEILFKVVENLEEREDSISLLLDSFNGIYTKKMMI